MVWNEYMVGLELACRVKETVLVLGRGAAQHNTTHAHHGGVGRRKLVPHRE